MGEAETVEVMERRLFVDVERRLRREKVGQVGRQRFVELLEEALEPRVVGPVVDLLFSALDPSREGRYEKCKALQEDYFCCQNRKKMSPKHI